MIVADESLDFGDDSSIRFFNIAEASKLSEAVRKRSVFARHSHENDFYLNRINELTDHTVIELFRSGDPKEIRAEAEEAANQIEKITLLSSVLVIKKEKFLKKLSLPSRGEQDLIISNQIRYISSNSKNIRLDGIHITPNFKNRFIKCGFPELYMFINRESDLSKRVYASINWLFESRCEPTIPAAIVKTAIALETLLIFDESESLTKPLSERVAYILFTDPSIRQRVSEIIIKFYKTRSKIVHGNNKKINEISLLEFMDRILILLYLTISHNSNLWHSVNDLKKWLDLKRWGYQIDHIIYPFPKYYINNTLALYK
jgi:hypothetical protein